MKMLFAARMERYDLLRATQSLASRVTKWSTDFGSASVVKFSKGLKRCGFVRDKLSDCQLLAARWAGEYGFSQRYRRHHVFRAAHAFHIFPQFVQLQANACCELFNGGRSQRCKRLAGSSRRFCEVCMFGKVALIR